MSENDSIPAGFIEITVERGGETAMARVPEGSTVGALIKNDHLCGVEVASTSVNGAPADRSTSLRNGDTVAQVPKSGRQGN